MKDTDDKRVNAIKDGQVVLENGLSIPIPFWTEPGRLVFFLVRHAEKGEGADPDLLPAGRKRSRNLGFILQHVAVDACYATPTQRTRQTVMTVSEMKQIPVIEYSPLLQIPLVRRLREEKKEGNFLIAGHLNTIPELVNYLIGSRTYSNIPWLEFDHFFLLVWRASGELKLLHLKY